MADSPEGTQAAAAPADNTRKRATPVEKKTKELEEAQGKLRKLVATRDPDGAGGYRCVLLVRYSTRGRNSVVQRGS